MTPTPEQLAEWTNAAQKVWDGQGRTHWVNMDQFDKYIAGYLRAKIELLDQPEPPKNMSTLALMQRVDELEALNETLKNEAQIHAMEAKSANATINEINQFISGATGEPANWHGAQPVKEFVNNLKAQLAALTQVIVERDLIIGQYIAEVQPPLAGEAT